MLNTRAVQVDVDVMIAMIVIIVIGVAVEAVGWTTSKDAKLNSFPVCPLSRFYIE